ncbi:hypothetical protein C7293_17960 [filamentous cyanobacterium CCT1]|nr:hypothetical protein C7293_17960 [filamentous cyanobacterium CCT1]PSN78572.1 hypothetical protein C8B47_16235 [filamentous cyanobacterium CCP4]
MNFEHSGIEKDDVFEIFLKTQIGKSDKYALHSTGKIYRLDQVLKALESLSSKLSNDVCSSLQQSHGIDLQTRNVLNDGIVCKVLGSESSGWEPGKLEIRIQMNFIPDIPEEPEGNNCQEKGGESDLDELRKLV